jgi:deoxyadenosine/deoxycytidine kinase
MSSATYIIEGNIGAGKSTFLRLLASALSAPIIFEPHAQWQHPTQSENLLHLFYQDPKRWAYTFQTYAFVSRIVAMQQEECSAGPVFSERSIYADRYCFAKLHFEAGNMTPLEWHLYQEWFSWLSALAAPIPQGFIYLRTEPTLCFERMRKRNRNEEKDVPLSYLEALHSQHEQWLIHKENIDSRIKDIPVLVLDANKEFEHDKAQLAACMEQVSSFVQQTHIPSTSSFLQAGL